VAVGLYINVFINYDGVALRDEYLAVEQLFP